MAKIYRVVRSIGTNQGFWEEHRQQVDYCGPDMAAALAAYLKAEPESGFGQPGHHGYLLRWECAEIDEAETPEDLDWQAVKAE